MSDHAADQPTTARELLAHRDYMLFWSTRVASTLGVQIQSVALGWQVYAVARQTHSVAQSAFYVGMIGLVTFIPVLLLALWAGEAADRYDRKRILQLCYAGEIASVLLLLAATLFGFATIPLLLGVAVLFGASRAFMGPAGTAMGPMLVPRSLLPRAIAWNSLAWQGGSIIGPALGGALVSISPAAAYGSTSALYLIAVLTVSLIAMNTKPVTQPGSRWTLIKEGLGYVWHNKIVFGAISLDLFAVLLGGATALLPVYARDILHVGPEGFGMLRAGPAIGATLVAIWLAANPIRSNAGPIMFVGVAIFALATIVFGLSEIFWLSVVALAVLGAADMLSVYVRQTLVQIVTPDQMRGRVAAVSSLFIGASNELGEFRTGVAARFMGAVGAAVSGGVAALIVTGVWAKLFPALRKADRLE
ncbi:MFS transporter [Phenylobacterium sp. Root77]|jgi:MFS family permease|uniref:MFS transporter n=1 Tax=unclassified Phenylobacterium TaxID=2640670 RepID=UPI0006F28A4D|nr:MULTISPECIES: MFS transporter [unclassified Phenylobacterium]KQW73069.1 MFS transporter [Phenylobacterium sp. Root1277]KQW92289.1 MFS transporter [Phenylobacterium sp. Root1290]KRC40520.1 MFS transporter [Phenylobacterium sp. Root77]